MTRREIMMRMRSQVFLVKKLEERMKEMSPDGVRSLKIGGVGGGGSAAERGIDVQIERREAIERMLTRERARLAEYEAEARREMEGMKPAEYAFCLMYCLEARPLKETSMLIDRSVRQCERYRNLILGE